MYFCDECIPDGYVAVDYDGKHPCDVCNDEAVYRAVKEDTPEGELFNTLLDFIGENHGPQEQADPCYDMLEMAKYILNKGYKKEGE